MGHQQETHCACMTPLTPRAATKEVRVNAQTDSVRAHRQRTRSILVSGDASPTVNQLFKNQSVSCPLINVHENKTDIFVFHLPTE